MENFPLLVAKAGAIIMLKFMSQFLITVFQPPELVYPWLTTRKENCLPPKHLWEVVEYYNATVESFEIIMS